MDKRHGAVLALLAVIGIGLTSGCPHTGPPSTRARDEATGAVSSLTPTEADTRVMRVEELLRSAGTRDHHSIEPCGNRGEGNVARRPGGNSQVGYAELGETDSACNEGVGALRNVRDRV